MALHFQIFPCLCPGAALCLSTTLSRAETPSANPPLPEALSAEAKAQAQDEYVKAYLLWQEAEKLSKPEDKAAALQKYELAVQILDRIARESPQWQPNLVKYRRDEIAKKLALLGKPAVTPATIAADAMEQCEGVMALLRAAEEMNKAGDATTAYRICLAAQKVLLRLATEHPGWDHKVVSHLASQLADKLREYKGPGGTPAFPPGRDIPWPRPEERKKPDPRDEINPYWFDVY